MVSMLFDGNTSDTFVNGLHIESLAEVLPDEDGVTLVADSTLVDASLLGRELHFISLVPRTFGARAQAVETWMAESDEVRPLGRTPMGTPRADAPPPPSQRRYRLVLDACAQHEQAIEPLRRSESHLVRLPDPLDPSTHSDAAILAEDRHQHLVEGSSGSRWREGPARITPAFLKKPIASKPSAWSSSSP